MEEVRCRRHNEPEILTQRHVRPEPLVLNHVKTQDSYATESKSKRTDAEDWHLRRQVPLRDDALENGNQNSGENGGQGSGDNGGGGNTNPSGDQYSVGHRNSTGSNLVHGVKKGKKVKR